MEKNTKCETDITIEERLRLFQGMISCSYNVFLWSYDTDLNLLSTDCPEDTMPADMLSMLELTSILKQHIKNKRIEPMILVTEFGFVWIVAFEHESDTVKRVHSIGPAFTGKNSMMIIKKKLDAHGLSVQIRAQVFKKIETVPIIQPNSLVQIAVMMHYAISREKIPMESVHFLTKDEKDERAEVMRISEEHRGIWFLEQQLIGMIREGNPDYKKALEKSMTLSEGMRVEYSDDMRKHKNNSLVLLTLCSRASIEGGLSSSVAYSLNDYYAAKIEECKNISESTSLTHTMLEDFVLRVRHAKELTDTSHQIQSAMEYIKRHIHEKISLKTIADQIGYTEYYLSHKFKQETGCNINDYIRNYKIEEAKVLLSGTTMSIIDISNELGFSNRSYFYSSFQKVTGLSPSEYRERNPRN